jgi:CMP-N-acetylneuraminic acid synthetase/mannose-6-phosphate isomerase-like protein (cupin superfamily)
MLKKIAMIPVLLGSTRIPDKNLILVSGYPLIFYVLKACKEADIFNDIYINSEHEVFRKIADMFEVKFYHRRPERGGSACTMSNKSCNCSGERCQVHDHYIADFLESVSCDYLTQIHTTSPLLRPETIRGFVKALEDYESLFSIEEKYAEAIYHGTEINFSKKTKRMTQDLTPLQVVSWALSGWNSKAFLNSYYRDDPEENGPTYCGRMGVYPISKIEALDADDWEDLYIVEACLSHLKRKGNLGKHQFTERITEIDSDLIRLISRDGVSRIAKSDGKKKLRSLSAIKREMGEAPWCYPLIYNDNDQICLICQKPGEGCRKHYHVTKDEWWLVVEGSFDWILDDGTTLSANLGDIISLPKGTIHNIVCTSDKPGIRLAGGLRDMEHIYVE